MGRILKAAFAFVFAVVFFVLTSCTVSSQPNQTASLNAEVHNWIEANLTERNAYQFHMTVKTYTQCGTAEYPHSTSYYLVTVIKDQQLAEIRLVGTAAFHTNRDLCELMQENMQQFVTHDNTAAYVSVTDDLLNIYLPADNGDCRLKGIRSETLSQTVLTLMHCNAINADCTCTAAEEDVHAAIPYRYVSWEISPDELYEALYELTETEEKNAPHALTAKIVYELENDALWATFDNAQELYVLIAECLGEPAENTEPVSRAVVTLHFGTDRYNVTKFSVPTV